MKRKSLFIFVLLLLAFLCPGVSNAMDEAEKTRISDRIDTMMRTMIAFAEKADVDQTFADLSSDKHAVFFVNDKVYDRSSLLKAFRETYGKLKSQKIDIKDSKVVVLGPDAAVWIAHAKGVTVDQSGVRSEESLAETWVWQNIDGKWAVTHYHETAIPAAE